jgi:hypothetical protein
MFVCLPTRQLILSPSGGGKTNIIVQQICNIYKDCFEAGIHVFSNSVFIDDAFKPIRQHMKDRGFEPEQYCHEGYSDEKLGEILAEQKSVIAYQKKKGQTKLFGLCILLDDVLDDARVMRNSNNLHLLFTRGRHLAISTIVSVQKYRSGSTPPIIRTQTTDEIIFKLRNAKDLESWIEESSALAPKETIMEIYRRAISKPYGFLWLKKTAKDPSDIFHIGFGTSGEKIE